LPSYSGGRNQKDHNSKPAQANSLQDPILKKKTLKKRAGGGPEFKSQYCKKKKKALFYNPKKFKTKKRVKSNIV
jgi:hypothetical protein